MENLFIPRESAGITFLEVIWTLLILAIIFSISIPGYAIWLPNYRLRQASRDLFSNLQLAKMAAIKDHVDTFILFDPDAGIYSIHSRGAEVKTIDLSTYGSGVCFGSGKATDDIPGSGSPPAESITYPKNQVCFTSKGMLSSTPGYVYLSNIRGAAYGVGTPTTAGVIVLKKWQQGEWK